ncbi:hypothetical protein SAMN05518683_11461 [Salibacterium halotolerans]|uniref:Uncharacterized protein n=1 Tax=Salibacterium halotolerans TaxID=1884432 RepID=A0A1I5UUG8_9BACI|nr:hypothetical protein SAMN05518683_11461 [Salibacterium halotolerans]
MQPVDFRAISDSIYEKSSTPISAQIAESLARVGVSWRDRLGIEPSGDGTRLPEVLKTLACTSIATGPTFLIRDVFYAFLSNNATTPFHFRWFSTCSMMKDKEKA